MRHSTLTATILLLMAPAAFGAVAVPEAAAASRRYTNLGGAPSASPVRAAHRVLTDRSGQFELDRIQLSPVIRARAWQGNVLVRFDQTYEELPVLGRGVLVRVDAAGAVQTVVTSVAQGLDVITLPVVTSREAESEAAAFWKLAFPRLVAVRLGILDDGRTGALVWQVDGNGPRGRRRVLVDALSGQVRRSYLLHQSAQGTVYPVNPVVTPNLEDRELPNLDGDESALNGRAAEVYRFVAGTVGNFDNLTLEQLATSDGTGFFYQPVEPALDDPFAEVMAYYHVDWIDNYYRTQHGHVPYRALTVIVNLTEDATYYENAFSSTIDFGRHALAFGQGSVIDYVYDADTIYHEFTHFVIDEVAGLEYNIIIADELGVNPAPAGIHEGLADYFAGSVTDDALVFNYGSYARDLDNDLVCPDDVFGESHEDGRIVGGTTWEMRAYLGDASLADAVIFGGLAMVASNTSLRDFALAMLDAAAALRDAGSLTQAQVDGLESILDSRGMLDCGRWLTLDDGQVRTTTEYGFDFAAQVSGMGDCQAFRGLGIDFTSFFQYRITVPADHDRLTIHIAHTPGTELLYSVHVRAATPVGFDVQTTPFGLLLPVAAEFDYVWTDLTEGVQALVLDQASFPPLARGQDYYISIARKNCPTATIEVSATSDSTVVPTPDAGVPDAGVDAGTDDNGGSDGCSCRQTRPAPAAPIALVLLALILTWRRRRTTRG